VPFIIQYVLCVHASDAANGCTRRFLIQLRQQIDRWAAEWIKRKFARGLELRAARSRSIQLPDLSVFPVARQGVLHLRSLPHAPASAQKTISSSGEPG